MAKVKLQKKPKGRSGGQSPALKIKARGLPKADPCANAKNEIKKAAAIVAQVLCHFGAGYAAQREIDSPASSGQIFDSPSTIATFHDLLLKSVITHMATLNWDTDVPGRDQVCDAAFQHGALARQTAGAAPLTITVVIDTLRVIQDTVCPPGAGGGPVCDF